MTTEITVGQMRHGTGPQIDAWCEWARANGLDPSSISGQHPVTVEFDTIHYRVFVRALDGRLYMTTEDVPASMAATAPLMVPMPEAWPEP